jgi:hypothetical protein
LRPGNPQWPARRFPPPWTVEDIGAAFVVTDSAGQKLAYLYFEDEPGRRSAAKLLCNRSRSGSLDKKRTSRMAARCP